MPAKVKYEDFFKRYYFLRAGLDAEEQKRKELLKGALEEEEVGWDSDAEGEESEGEDEDEKGLEERGTGNAERAQIRNQASTETLQAPSKPMTSADAQSAADSDTSYDIVSGAPSRSGGSPKGMNKKVCSTCPYGVRIQLMNMVFVDSQWMMIVMKTGSSVHPIFAT